MKSGCRHFKGGLQLILLHARTISIEEMRAWQENPWQIFKPLPGRTYVGSLVPGAPAGSTIAQTLAPVTQAAEAEATTPGIAVAQTLVPITQAVTAGVPTRAMVAQTLVPITQAAAAEQPSDSVSSRVD